MSGAFFPLTFCCEEVHLLTAILIGGLFGFSLERAGFGSARKLTAQFYLYDMSVFKVMFTAVLVAMVGLYSLSAMGLADLSLIWINPTFVWAHLVGGFLLGVGFIMSGLCPGTAVVSAGSGRLDALWALGGILMGTVVFALTIDRLPGLHALYEGGSLGVSTLPALLGVVPLWLVLAIVAVALVCFIVAEKVEKIFQARLGTLELAPAPSPWSKFALAGSLALVAVIGVLATAPPSAAPPAAMSSLAPMDLAEAIIARRPDLVVLDVRAARTEEAIPGSHPVAADESAVPVLEQQASAATVVVVDEQGSMRQVPAAWPGYLQYRYLEGGFAGWRDEILTPAEPAGTDLAEVERVERRNQVGAYFSGAAVAPTKVDAPPPAMAPGKMKKKKKRGC